ncbi:MAG TPA: cupin domain-containing protein [Thermoleophilaceae bacterium]|nr:cupin domain-containing protein [Thermoleophilaceae bacterium]
MHRVTLGRPIGEQSDWEMFRGEVHYQPIANEQNAELFRSAHISFRPGARTQWHHHGCDQMLIVTGGHGTVASEDEEIPVRTGDVVIVPAGTRHWHGATAESDLSHISVLTPADEVIHEDQD